jgi:uncharacterized protein (TIGR03067 family)
MTYLKTYSCLAIGLLFFVVAACTGRSPDQPKTNLTGEYRIVSGERNGTSIDQNELNNATITISDTTITAYDKERKETFIATYTLETTKKPWQITMTSIKAPETGVIAKGLIEADHNGVKLIYALPHGQPPTDFRAGEQQQMFVMEKTGTTKAKG